MNQHLLSNLTQKIEQEKQMMQEHQQKLEYFQKSTYQTLQDTQQQLEHFQKSTYQTLQDTQQQLEHFQTQAQNKLNNINEQLQSFRRNVEHTTELATDQYDNLNQNFKSITKDSQSLSSYMIKLVERSRTLEEQVKQRVSNIEETQIQQQQMLLEEIQTLREEQENRSITHLNWLMGSLTVGCVTFLTLVMILVMWVK